MGLGGSKAKGDEEEETIGEASTNPLAQGYEDLVNAIIRPPRMEYSMKDDMGPATFSLCGKRFCREDLEIENKRGLKLVCSWWKFTPEDAPAEQLPVVIYMHGNASCRIAAFELLRHLLPVAITVFALDFAGSGLSGGEHVSLGYYEQEDVEAVIGHLRASGSVSTVGLWGHSMGAATALLYADRDPSIAGMIVDSAFSDLMVLINEFGQNIREQGLRVPGFAISAAVGMISRSVRKRAKFNPKDVSPIANGDKAFIPALFAHGKDDAFIRPSHSEQLHANYSGDKELVLFDGDHNSTRPDFLFTRAVTFLYQRLGVQEAHCLDSSSPTHGSAPQFDNGLFAGGAAAVHNAEEEMMRQALMMSLNEHYDGRSGGGTASGAPAGEARPQSAGDNRPAAQPATAQGGIPMNELKQGIVQFHSVAGVGGITAQYYVEAALADGGSVEHAIERYFDSDCAGPPPGYQPPAPEFLAL